MADILKAKDRQFSPNPGRIDSYRLFTDMSRESKQINPDNLNFDIRLLNSNEYSSLYHFHHHAEELFVILSGRATLRTPEGLHILETGDLAFFKKGKEGAHQLFNHTEESCTFLDIRTFFQSDVCEYPDSNKLLIVPQMDIYKKGNDFKLFDGEDDIKEIWKNLNKK